MHKKMEFFYESNDKTTTGRLRQGVGKDADELVPALPEGLARMGMTPGMRVLPPRIVKWISEHFCIDVG